MKRPVHGIWAGIPWIIVAKISLEATRKKRLEEEQGKYGQKERQANAYARMQNTMRSTSDMMARDSAG